MESTTLKESLILHCKFTIKSFSQLLKTPTNDSVQELRHDEEVMVALADIASLAAGMSSTGTQRFEDGADPVEDGNDRTRDEAPISTLPGARQDSGTAGPPLPGTLISQTPGPSMGFSSAGKQLHSILLYYPLMSMIGLPLSVAERDLIQQDVEVETSTPLASQSYPSIRLLPKQVVLILHDDVDELEVLRAWFLLDQKMHWEHSTGIDLNFRFVRRWGQPPTLIIFQHDYNPHLPSATKQTIKDIVARRKDVAGVVMARFPVFHQYQQFDLDDGPPTGAKVHQGALITRTIDYGNGASSSQSFRGPRLAVVIPITSDAFGLAQDFSNFYSPFTYEGVNFDIKVQKLQDPSNWLAEDGLGWDNKAETVTSYQ